MFSPRNADAASPAARYARIVTNFVHDVSTGTWVACMLIIWTISSRAAGVSAEAADVLAAANTNVFWLLAVSLVGIAVTGVARLFYWRGDTPVDQRAAKRTALVVKHAVLLVVYGAGTLWAAGMVF